MSRIIVLLVGICFLVSCQRENSKSPIRKEIVKSPSSDKKELSYENKPEEEMLKHLKEKYSNVYVYEVASNDAAEGKEIQYLAINYLENKNINFYLYTETLPCDTQYFGLAIKEDHPDFTIFKKEEKEYKINIQLNLDKTEATIGYVQKDSLETDCLPIDQTVMKKVK